MSLDLSKSNYKNSFTTTIIAQNWNEKRDGPETSLSIVNYVDETVINDLFTFCASVTLRTSGKR